MLMRNLTKFRQLPPDERWLLVRSILFLPVIHAALRVLGYSRTRRCLETWLPLSPGKEKIIPEEERLQRAQEIARIIAIAAVHGFNPATCLRRSLLLWGYLRGEGIDGRVCFGVRMLNGTLEAHAWVEYQGVVVNDSERVREAYQLLEDALPPTKLGL
jgi:hypothetical protein